MTEHITPPPEQPEDDTINWERVQIWSQTGVMFLMGLYFVDLAVSGNLSNYINTDNFGWLTWTGAFILFAIAGANMLQLMTNDTINTDNHQSTPNYDPYNRQSTVWAGWFFIALVSVPLMLGLGVSSEPLGASAVGNELSSDISTINVGNISSADIPAANRNLLDWVRIFSQSPDMSEYAGDNVNVIGFVYKDARFAGTDNFMVVRFTLSCCVADARPIGLMVQNADGVTIEQDTWVNITGTIAIEDVDGVPTPVIVTDSIEPTEQPEQPYLYF